MKNKFIIFSLFLGLLVFLTGSLSTVSALTDKGQRTDLIKKIAGQFKLKENDVQKVFDDYQNNRQKTMQDKFMEKLNKAVKDKKITEAQKQLILKKHEELRNKRQQMPDNWSGLSPDERRQFKEKQRQELETWAKNNGLDISYFFGMNRNGRGYWFK